MKQLPRTCVSRRVFAIIVKRIIVLLHPAIEIIRLAGVEFSGLCGAEDVHEEQICPPLHSGRIKAETLSRLFLQSSPKGTLCVTMRACFEESGLTKNSNHFDADRSADHTAPTSNTNRLILLENCNLHVW